MPCIVEQLEASKSERLAPILGAGRMSLADDAPGDATQLLQIVERIAAALFTLESIAYGVNENFMAFCDRRRCRDRADLPRVHPTR